MRTEFKWGLVLAIGVVAGFLIWQSSRPKEAKTMPFEARPEDLRRPSGSPFSREPARGDRETATLKPPSSAPTQRARLADDARLGAGDAMRDLATGPDHRAPGERLQIRPEAPPSGANASERAVPPLGDLEHAPGTPGNPSETPPRAGAAPPNDVARGGTTPEEKAGAARNPTAAGGAAPPAKDEPLVPRPGGASPLRNPAVATRKPAEPAVNPAAGSGTAPTGAAYVIQPGDTLISIAREKLGGDREWRRIQEANPGLTPERLLVGTTIKLPGGAAGSDPPRAAADSPPIRRTTPAAPPKTASDPRVERGSPLVAEKPAPPVRNGTGAKPTTNAPTTQQKPSPAASPQRSTYVVGRGESLRTIAKNVLKDERRWREIYELNKARIKNPNVLFEGVELKLPERKVSTSRKRD